MDFTYWISWKYAGFRFQGAGLDIREVAVHEAEWLLFPTGKLQLFQEAEAVWRRVWLRETSCCDCR